MKKNTPCSIYSRQGGRLSLMSKQCRHRLCSDWLIKIDLSLVKYHYLVNIIQSTWSSFTYFFNNFKISINNMKKKIKWLWMLFVICFAIPSFVIVYCYSKFVLNVSRVNRDVKNFDQNSTKKRLETPARLTVLVAILCLAFFWKGNIFPPLIFLLKMFYHWSSLIYHKTTV